MKHLLCFIKYRPLPFEQGRGECQIYYQCSKPILYVNPPPVDNMKIIFKLKKFIVFILVVTFVFPLSGGIYEIPEAEAGFRKVIFLTTANTTWTVPNDWNNQANIVEVIGGGGGAGDGSNEGAGGAGGGAYSKSINLQLTRGAAMTNFSVGAAGVGGETNNASGTSGGNTWFNAATFALCTVNTLCVKAEGGKLSAGNAITNGAGGLASNGVGTVTKNGGDGGAGDSGTPDAGGGGGGAGGPNGDGNVGVAGTSTGAGGSGDAGYGGAGGSTGATNGQNGGNGSEWQSTAGAFAGSGGGGEGATDGVAGGSGGSYGGGGGGGEVQASPFADGGAGIIIITYIPAGHVVRGNVKIRGGVKFR